MPRGRRIQPVLACARCYSLKKKCDRKLPSCSRCISTGKECVGLNRHSRSEVPRSVFQYLEKRLAEIEQGYGRQPVPGLVDTSTDTTVSEGPTISADVYTRAIQSIGASIRGHCTTTCVESHPRLLHESKLLYPTERPPHKLPVHGLYYEHLGKQAGSGNESQFAGLNALRIPFEVARRIFENYVTTILPRYPCFTSNELWHHFGQVYSNQQSTDSLASDISRFIVSMVLAVGCLTSWRREFSRVAAMSESLYRDAICHWTFLRESNMVSLQGILLLIQLGLYLPYINNIYYLCAEAVRMAVGLGLHQEAHPAHGLPPREVSVRRQVFWTVYLVDRTIATSTGSPVCVSDEHISTALPGSEGNSHSVETSTFYSDGRQDAKQFLSQLQLCRLQSEIYEIKFFDRAIPDQFATHADWVQHTEERISDALELSVSAEGVIPQWIANAAYLSQNLLHRPYPGDMDPNHNSLVAATTSGINLINGYHRISQTSRLMRTFSVVDNAFQAAIVLFYIFGNYAHVVREASLEDKLMEAVDNLMIILDVGTQRWPVIAITSVYVRDLRDVVFSLSSGSIDSAKDIKLRKELELLLSQRRIRSIYQASTEIQHAFQTQDPSPNGNFELPFLADMWQEFMNFDFEQTDSLNFLETSWLTQETTLPLPDSADVADEIEAPKLPKDILDAIDSLPACSLCRDRRIRCDRELPSCGACHRSKHECAYFDLITSREIPRRKIHDMIQRITTAYQVVPTPHEIFPGAAPTSKPVPSTDVPHSYNLNILISEASSDKAASEMSEEMQRPSVQASGQDYMFLGATSHLASVSPILTSISQHALPTLLLKASSRAKPTLTTSPHQVISPEVSNTSALFAVFYRSIHVWYPVMSDDALQKLLSCFSTEPFGSSLSPNQELSYLILAISAQLTKRAEPHSGFTAAAYFKKATSDIDTSCDHSSGSQTLHMMQRTLLICLYLLLSPGEGDIWRNLGFAIRLYFDMSHGRFENLDSLDEGHLAMLARTLYCIEGKVTIAFGRPTVLITGDKLRDDLTQSITGTTEESLSKQFYQISTMKMQLHSLLLSVSSHQREPGKLNVRYAMIRQELLDWQTSWTTVFIPSTVSQSHDWTQAAQYLEAWGSLQYNATALILAKHYSETTEGSYDAAKQVVRCCSILVRQHQYSFCALPAEEMRSECPIFPVDWTISHLLFAAAIQLLSPGIRDSADREDWDRTLRSALVSMALMEADPAHLSMGFSEILEKLYDTQESLVTAT